MNKTKKDKQAIDDLVLKQSQAIVKNNVIESISLTITNALKQDPEILDEANNYNPENDNYTDPLEFWSIDDWLYNELKRKGEIVFEYLDFLVWGRYTSGQALWYDEVIQEIAKDYLQRIGKI